MQYNDVTTNQRWWSHAILKTAGLLYLSIILSD